MPLIVDEVQAHIRGFSSPLVGEVRGRGLMIGIELVEDPVSRAPLKGERAGARMGYLLSLDGILMRLSPISIPT